jgi:Family of unknown function (DUF5997)
MSARRRLSVLVGMMTVMANRDAVLHPRQAAAALGVSRGALRRAGQDRCYSPAEIADLRADPPRWLIVAREQRKAWWEREQADRERRTARQAGELELADAYRRALKDRGDTDCWAAGVLDSGGIHRIDLGDGEVVPVLPPSLKLVR